MAKVPEGYRWVYVNACRVLVKDKGFDYVRDIDTDDFVDNQNDDIKGFVSDEELMEYRRDLALGV